ncbi:MULTISPECIES: hypothetical protein [Clostridium]|uniref:hypothetical protein n=1 Tax=Clostridium pasteurianum TaxID=1501 RepID=UPI0008249908|nr:hypothetical protein CUB90_08675 [Clostridium sp. CT7]
MKKSIIAAAIIIVCAAGIYYYKFISDFSYLVTMKDNITSIESSSSNGSFNGKKHEKIKFFCNSKINHGVLNIILIDPNGKIIKKFKTNKNYTEEISLNSTGKYKFPVNYNKFIGDFNVKCR